MNIINDLGFVILILHLQWLIETQTFFFSAWDHTAIELVKIKIICV